MADIEHPDIAEIRRTGYAREGRLNDFNYCDDCCMYYRYEDGCECGELDEGEDE